MRIINDLKLLRFWMRFTTTMYGQGRGSGKCATGVSHNARLPRIGPIGASRGQSSYYLSLFPMISRAYRSWRAFRPAKFRAAFPLTWLNR